jgi:hypothetical protein
VLHLGSILLCTFDRYSCQAFRLLYLMISKWYFSRDFEKVINDDEVTYRYSDDALIILLHVGHYIVVASAVVL